MTSRWKTRIAKAKKSGDFEYGDREDASSWKCCAVGEHLGLAQVEAKSYEIGLWLDKNHNELYELGMEFTALVDRGNWDKAQQILNWIHEIPRPKHPFK